MSEIISKGFLDEMIELKKRIKELEATIEYLRTKH